MLSESVSASRQPDFRAGLRNQPKEKTKKGESLGGRDHPIAEGWEGGHLTSKMTQLGCS